MKKRMWNMLLVLIMMLSLSACGEENTDNNIEHQTITNTESTENKTDMDESAVLDDSEKDTQIFEISEEQKRADTVLSASQYYMVALRNNGTVAVEISSENGARSTEFNQAAASDWTDITAISTGFSFYVAGLKSDGTVVMTGPEGTKEIAGWTDIIQVANGNTYVVGLKNDGTVKAVLHDQSLGELSDDISSWTDIIMISAKSGCVVGVKKDGTVVAAGTVMDTRNPGSGKKVSLDELVSGWKDIVSVSVGAAHVIGLKKDGTVEVVEISFTAPSIESTSSWQDIIAVSAGSNHVVGLKSDGTVVTTATDATLSYEEEVGKWTDIEAISAGVFCTVGLKADGTIVVAGEAFDFGEKGDFAREW